MGCQERDKIRAEVAWGKAWGKPQQARFEPYPRPNPGRRPSPKPGPLHDRMNPLLAFIEARQEDWAEDGQEARWANLVCEHLWHDAPEAEPK